MRRTWRRRRRSGPREPTPRIRQRPARGSGVGAHGARRGPGVGWQGSQPHQVNCSPVWFLPAPRRYTSCRLFRRPQSVPQAAMYALYCCCQSLRESASKRYRDSGRRAPRRTAVWHDLPTGRREEARSSAPKRSERRTTRPDPLHAAQVFEIFKSQSSVICGR